jgi:hypothetical protein
LGIEVPDHGVRSPEHRLYELLAQDDSDSAHSRGAAAGLDPRGDGRFGVAGGGALPQCGERR